MQTRFPRTIWVFGGVLVLIAVGLTLFTVRLKKVMAPSDEFLRVSNIGRNQLETGDAPGAIQSFERAVQLNPTHPDVRLNLANALLVGDQPARALAEFQAILAADPTSPAGLYLAGCASVRLGKYDDAIRWLQQAKAVDKTINAVSFQLALAYEGLTNHPAAIEQLTEVIQFEPEHPAAHYRLSQLLLRAGRRDEAAQELATHQAVLAKNPPGFATPATYERCVYTRIRLPFVLEQPVASGIRVRFTDATAEAFDGLTNAPSGPVAVVDFEGSGHQNLVGRREDRWRLWRNRAGRLSVQGAGVPAISNAVYGRTFSADLDNDSVADVLVLGDRGSQVFKFTTNGTFTDTTAFARQRWQTRDPAASGPPPPVLVNLAAREGLLLDQNFQGNLDLFALTPDGRDARVLRNFGGMYFGTGTNTGFPTNFNPAATQLLTEDWNGDELLDVIVGRAGQAPSLFVKLRGGPLVPTNSPADWPSGGVIATGDFNNDLRPDLLVATTDRIAVIFHGVPAHGNIPLAGFVPERLVPLDYDNDGWLDLVGVGDGLRVWRNLGRQGFRDVTTELGVNTPSLGRCVTAHPADLDGDGDTDLVVETAAGPARYLRNEGGNANHQIRLVLLGNRSNRSGLGTRIEIATGGLRLVRRVDRLPVEIGVGRYPQIDSLQARWLNLSPAYTDLPVQPTNVFQLIELSIQEGSCPYLYAWDGQRYQFITDILGSAPLGLPVAAGRYIEADEDELVRIGDDTTFRPLTGRYFVQLTEELREVLYLDEAKLVVVDHPAGTEVHSTDKLRMGRPPGGYPRGSIITLHRRHPLLRAENHQGTDVTAALQAVDGNRVSPTGRRTPELRGHAEPHAVVLDFGSLEGTNLVLALTGWLRFGGGMANIAASTHPDLPFPFPVLEAETAAGQWQRVDLEVGAPSGKTKTIVVELGRHLPPGTRRLRLGAGFEIHWDRIALFERAPDAGTTVTRLAPGATDLHWRGFSGIALDRPWSEPFTPIYEELSPNALWTLTPGGWCTRYGPVDELVAERDNALVLLNGGDELTLSWPVTALPARDAGSVRDYFLFTSGWDKDSDFHVATGTTVEPIPWHGLDDQLYGRQPRPAFTNDAWMSRYNTRWVGPRVLTRRQ